jgi:hypothetical protein
MHSVQRSEQSPSPQGGKSWLQELSGDPPVSNWKQEGQVWSLLVYK